MLNGRKPSEILSTVLMGLPVVAYALRCVQQARWEELGLLAFNLVGGISLAVYHWGPAVIVIIAQIAAAIVGLIVLAVTADRS